MKPNATSPIKICVPGKLILSGEHSVVYGQPAIAMAVNRYVTATISSNHGAQISFDLSDLSHRSLLTFDALSHLKNRIKQKYKRFIRGEYSIREVLQKPFELAQYALSIFSDSLNLNIPHGIKIKVQSDLPIGCGMGSSAATILSVLKAMSHYLQLPLSTDALYQLALEAENMQHGFSSGLDLKIAMHGGCFYMHQDQILKRPLPNVAMSIVNTGTPDSSTGQCIEKVAPYFKETSLLNDFAAVTNRLDYAMQQQSLELMQDAIRDNHQLLVRIGVVPQRVQRFIAEIEKKGFSGKICGSGAVAGEGAGAVLVLMEDGHALTQLCKQYGYTVMPITGEMRGIHAA